jgi:hypothetical protein
MQISTSGTRLNDREDVDRASPDPVLVTGTAQNPWDNQDELVVHVVTGFGDQVGPARQPSIRWGRYRSFFSLPVSRKELAFS